MPAEQRGSVYKTRDGFGVQYRDESGTRRRQSGFKSRSAARAWFRDVAQPRMRGENVAPDPLTLAEFCENYLKRYEAVRSPVSVQTLRWRLARPLAEFGDVELQALRTGEIATWEASLPPRFRHAVVRALRQVLDAAVAWEYLARNPAKGTGQNPAPSVIERVALEPVQVEALAAELGPVYGVAAIVGAWCYLRPAELLGAERRDVDLDNGLLHVRGTKTLRSVRAVPLPLRAREALAELPARLSSRLLFPGPSETRYDLRNFRCREFYPAVEAAGLPESVTPYTLRHSGISWALASGIPASDVAKFGGTSVTMLERVYHHLLEGSAEAARQRLDAFTNDAASAEVLA